MINNIDFIQEYYQDQIKAYNAFIKDAYLYLPNRDNSLIRFGGGTALAIYYFQHRLSFDIDLFVTDIQILNYLSPKHWIEETNLFNSSSYIDLSNHIRVLHKENNIKIDVLVAQEASKEYLIDDSKKIFDTTIYIESIEDIIAKKIVYRRKDNLTRDIIDIAISIKYADNILQKLYDMEKIDRDDVQELYNSLLELDLNTFSEEVEIVQPFEKYLDDAYNAPEMIQKVCRDILKAK
jgi:predicted nucleotidyltransferase component of viral defense system